MDVDEAGGRMNASVYSGEIDGARKFKSSSLQQPVCPLQQAVRRLRPFATIAENCRTSALKAHRPAALDIQNKMTQMRGLRGSNPVRSSREAGETRPVALLAQQRVQSHTAKRRRARAVLISKVPVQVRLERHPAYGQG
jgi:hypothetical protein